MRLLATISPRDQDGIAAARRLGADMALVKLACGEAAPGDPQNAGLAAFLAALAGEMPFCLCLRNMDDAGFDKALAVAISAAVPAAIVLRGAQGRADMERLGAKLRVQEAELGLEDGTIGIIPVIETAAGVLSVSEWQPHRRLVGLACAPRLLSRALKVRKGGEVESLARAATLLAARRADAPALIAWRGKRSAFARASRLLRVDGFGGMIVSSRLGKRR